MQAQAYILHGQTVEDGGSKPHFKVNKGMRHITNCSIESIDFDKCETE